MNNDLLAAYLTLAFADASPADREKALTSATTVSGGNSGLEIIKIKLVQKQYILRQLPPNERSQREFLATKLAGEKGVGPRVSYPHSLEQLNNFILVDFVDGRPFNDGDLNRLPQLAALIKKSMQISHEHLSRSGNYHQRIEFFLADFDSPLKTTILEQLHSEAEPSSRQVVFCHNDINYHNLIVDEDSICFIDWADAGLNDPLEQVAGFCNEAQLSIEQGLLFCHQVGIEVDAAELTLYQRLNALRHAVWAIKRLQQLGVTYQREQGMSFSQFIQCYRNGKISLNHTDGLAQLAHAALNYYFSS